MKIYKISNRKYEFDNQKNAYYKILEREEPFRENYKLRVFHAFRDPSEAYMTAVYGLSGKERVGRAYSYESNNNPSGLFVSINFETVKQFTSFGYIMEFEAKYSDLESPVWPSGGYTVQGQMAEYWDWDKLEEQRNEARLVSRQEALESEYDAIKNNDRPELANSLMNTSEHQALFIGDLSPNEIEAFWIPIIQPDGVQRVTDQWERLPKEEFLEKFTDDMGKRQQYENIKSRHRELKKRPFTPDQEFEVQFFLDNVGSYGATKLFKIISDLPADQAKEALRGFLWPKQISAMETWIDSL